MKTRSSLVLGLFLLALVLVACGGGEVEVTRIVEVTRVVEVEVAGEAGPAEAVTFAGGGDTLAEVQGRGILNCGVSGSLLAFSFAEEDGSISGFDHDYCRAVAAATLGDSEALNIRTTNASERFPVLQSGEIDVLIFLSPTTTIFCSLKG